MLLACLVGFGLWRQVKWLAARVALWRVSIALLNWSLVSRVSGIGGHDVSSLVKLVAYPSKLLSTKRKVLKSLQEMGEKDKEQNPTPAGIYTKESVGKVT